MRRVHTANTAAEATQILLRSGKAGGKILPCKPNAECYRTYGIRVEDASAIVIEPSGYTMLGYSIFLGNTGHQRTALTGEGLLLINQVYSSKCQLIGQHVGEFLIGQSVKWKREKPQDERPGIALHRSEPLYRAEDLPNLSKGR